MIERASWTGSFPASSDRLLKFVYAFEDIADDLPLIPLAARRVLDAVGRKLSLDGWLSLHLADRKVLLLAGAAELIDLDVVDAVLSRATPSPTPLSPVPQPPAVAPPRELVDALGPDRPIDAEHWGRLHAVERYILAKLAGKPDKLVRAYDEIIGAAPPLVHLGPSGEARMVDIGPKAATSRRAIASARVTMSSPVLDRVARGEVPKGDVFAAARIAGIQAAKKTPDLIPLCHTIALTRVEISFSVDRALRVVFVRAVVEAFDRTGVEMEALVAASTSALTIYDMLKSADRWITISEVRLEEKSGGKSGDVRRSEHPGPK